MAAGASVRSTAGLRLATPTARQRFRRGVCPQTVRLYGQGAQQSMKRCVGVFKRLAFLLAETVTLGTPEAWRKIF